MNPPAAPLSSCSYGHGSCPEVPYRLDHRAVMAYVVGDAVCYRGVKRIDDVPGPYVVVHGIVRRRIMNIKLTGGWPKVEFGR
jgi:hypothetical protein